MVRRSSRVRYTAALFTLTLLSLSACGKDKPTIDAPLQPFVDEFFAESAARNINLSHDVSAHLVDAELKDVDGELLIAVCDRSPREGSFPTISVRNDFWLAPGADDVVRKATVFHELGHCALGRSHTTNMVRSLAMSVDIPTSIMFPRAFVAASGPIRAFYLDHQKEYFDELFGITPTLALTAEEAPLYPAAVPAPPTSGSRPATSVPPSSHARAMALSDSAEALQTLEDFRAVTAARID